MTRTDATPSHAHTPLADMVEHARHVRLDRAAISDRHRRAGHAPPTASEGVRRAVRGLAKGVRRIVRRLANQAADKGRHLERQAAPLTADCLAAIRATAHLFRRPPGALAVMLFVAGCEAPSAVGGGAEQPGDDMLTAAHETTGPTPLITGGDEARALILTDLTGRLTSIEDVRRMGSLEAELRISQAVIVSERRALDVLRGPNPPLDEVSRRGLASLEDAIMRVERNLEAELTRLDDLQEQKIRAVHLAASFLDPPSGTCEGQPDILQAITTMAVWRPWFLSQYIRVTAASWHGTDRNFGHVVNNKLRIKNAQAGNILREHLSGVSAFTPCLPSSPTAHNTISVDINHPEIHLLCAESNGTHEAHGTVAPTPDERSSVNPRGCVHLAS